MPAELTEEELAELERLNEEAMPPPWCEDRIDDDSFCALDVITVPRAILEEIDTADPDHPPIVAYLSHPDHSEGVARDADAKLIVAVRNALPALLASARAVRNVERIVGGMEADLADLKEDGANIRAYAHALETWTESLNEALTAAAEPTDGEER